MKAAVIAGAGIGGLAAGIALRQAGYEVTVLERSPQPGEVGAGVAILPNGTRALEALGVPPLPPSGLTNLTVRTWRGVRLLDTPVGTFRRRYGSEFKVVPRPELHALLLQTLGPERVSPGTEVTGFSQTASAVRVVLGNGRELEAGLLVGADGLRSAVRRQLLDDGEPRYLGCTAWRGTLDLAGSGLEPSLGLNWWGLGGEFGALPMQRAVYWFATANAPERQPDPRHRRRQDLLARFAGWEAPIPDLIARTEADAILRNDIYDRPPARRWTSGRVTLLGDAAHPMAPNAAQGACQALEDAVALGAALGGGAEPEAGLLDYERRRLPRANEFVRLAHRTSRAVQSDNRVLVGARNLSVRLVPQWLLERQADRTFAPSPRLGG
ncbi:MAG TPA: FAD-dependent monooxygenase [Candidatus Acidoferrales bacterium]|nr:FAD-dependent monooxygenase [Candidatus Acidoferrales bacterium]